MQGQSGGFGAQGEQGPSLPDLGAALHSLASSQRPQK